MVQFEPTVQPGLFQACACVFQETKSGFPKERPPPHPAEHPCLDKRGARRALPAEEELQMHPVLSFGTCCAALG